MNQVRLGCYGCGNMPLKSKITHRQNTPRGNSPLLNHMSECAFLIWKLRCKRIIPEQQGVITAQEANNQVRTLTSKKDTGAKLEQKPSLKTGVWFPASSKHRKLE